MAETERFDKNEPLSKHISPQLQIKEDGSGVCLVATSHPDRVGDVLSKTALQQIADSINNTSVSGGTTGSFRSISLNHDWIKENNPALDAAGFLKPEAKMVQLEDGHWGVEVPFEINKHYKNDDGVTPEEIEYRIKNGAIAGLSIEFEPDPEKTKKVNLKEKVYRFIDGLKRFAGVGFARDRMIANPNCVIYKEIEEGENMVETPVPEVKEAPIVEQKEAPKETPKLDVKEIVNNPEFKEMLKSAVESIEVKSKVIKSKEENMEVPLSIKEMNESLKKPENGLYNTLSYKEAFSKFAKEQDAHWKQQASTFGIPLRSTLQMKTVDNKLVIVGGLEVKDTLDTTTNTSSYTQNIAEFADVFQAGIVDTFNNATPFFQALPKKDAIMGGDKHGWTITTGRASSLAVDPNDTSIVKNAVNKLKLQTEFKEYRTGVEVTDWVLHFARASLGDLMALEVQKSMNDLMVDIETDLFTEQGLETQNKVIGLEYVADSAGNTTLYGLTRSTANRLAPAAAGDTYNNVGGAITTAVLRAGIDAVETEGAKRANMRIVTAPAIRTDLFELEDGNIRYIGSGVGATPGMGFNGALAYDGIPVIVSPFCQSDSLYIVDFESEYIVLARPPQMIGLAKVGASESAYISVYLAHVYEQPRRIHMLNGLT